MDNKKRILDFIQNHRLAVISTVNSAALPESSVIGFSSRDNFELIFGTYDSSRKYANLKRSPRVALVIGWEHGQTVQLEGEAVEIDDPKELEQVKRIHLEKMPSAAKYVRHESEKFFKITPHWIKYSNLSVDPWEELELKFV